MLWAVLTLIGAAVEAGARPEPQIIGDAIVVPLTEQAASAEIGERIFVAREADTVFCATKSGSMRPFRRYWPRVERCW